MKRKLYTRSHDESLLRSMARDESPFTAEEHARVIETESAVHFQSRESILRWYLSHNAMKLTAVGFLTQHVYRMNFKNVVSFGAGPCILEYLLKCALADNAEVLATDFDVYYIQRAAALFPELLTTSFDFFTDDAHLVSSHLRNTPDLAVFIGSAYVMDDEQFIRLFTGIRRAGFKQLIDFGAGYMDLPSICRSLLDSFKGGLKTILPVGAYPFRGKFHGYGRTRRELRRLYYASGFNILSETSVGGYQYVAICERSQ